MLQNMLLLIDQPITNNASIDLALFESTGISQSQLRPTVGPAVEPGGPAVRLEV